MQQHSHHPILKCIPRTLVLVLRVGKLQTTDFSGAVRHSAHLCVSLFSARGLVLWCPVTWHNTAQNVNFTPRVAALTPDC